MNPRKSDRPANSVSPINSAAPVNSASPVNSISPANSASPAETGEHCESLIWPQGLKRTKSREAVMTALVEEKLPVTALYLFEKIQKGAEPVWLSTIYRVLESFTEKNAVIKSMPTDSTMAVYEWNRHTHMHYAVCVNCHSMVPIKDCPFEYAVPPVAGSNFHIVGHNLELYGYCDKCYKNKEGGH